MKGKGSGLGSESKEQTDSRSPERPYAARYTAIHIDFLFIFRQKSLQILKQQRSRHTVQKKNPHQHYQTADHRNRKIGSGGPQRFLPLVMSHPHIGGQRHDLKENKGRIEISGQENAHCCAKRDQQKKIITVSVSVMSKIFSGKQCRHHPHKGGNGTVQSPEPVQGKMQAEAAHSRHVKTKVPGNLSGRCLHHQKQKQAKGKYRCAVRKIVPGFFMISAKYIGDHPRSHRESHAKR